MAESMQLASRLGRMARAGRAGRAGRPRGRAEHLARGRRTAETARDDDGAARQTSSTTRPGGKRSATEGGLGCGGGDGMRRRDDARCGPGGWRGRAGVEDDGGAVETSSMYGRADRKSVV